VMMLSNLATIPFSIIPFFANNNILEGTITAISSTFALSAYVISLILVQVKKLTLASWLIILALGLSTTLSAITELPTLLSIFGMLVVAILGLVLLNSWVAYGVLVWAGLLGLINILMDRLIFAKIINQAPAKLDFMIFALFFLVMVVTVWLASTLADNFRKALRAYDKQAAILAMALIDLEEKRKVTATVGNQILNVNKELSGNATQQSAGSQQQVAAVTEVTSTLVEMSKTAQQISDTVEGIDGSLKQALKLAHNLQNDNLAADEQANSGQEEINHVLEMTHHLHQRIELLGQGMLTLNNHSKNAGGILALINQIADETHLLALNASIEAAGAGETGARFQIIASEVKNLADRTRSATGDVQTVITDMQGAVASSVLAAEEARKDIQKTVERSGQAGKVIENLGVVVNRTSQSSLEVAKHLETTGTLLRQIVFSTQQQESASTQIVSTMQNIGEVAQQNASASLHVAKTVTYLEELSQELNTSLEVA
jgi:methyl-accepting chemotaxis protein